MAMMVLIGVLSVLKKTGAEKNDRKTTSLILSRAEPLFGSAFSAGFVTKAEVSRGLLDGQAASVDTEQVVYVKDASGQWERRRVNGLICL